MVPGGNDERDASSSRLHSRNALAAEWLVSKSANASGSANKDPRPSKAEESHTATVLKIATTAGRHPNEGARRGPAVRVCASSV